MTDPVGDIDKQMTDTMRLVHRGRWTALALLLVLMAAGLAALGWTSVTEASRLQASCRFYRDLGTAALSLSHPPQQEGVALVVDARRAYSGQGCGTLPPPSPELSQLASRYGLRLP